MTDTRAALATVLHHAAAELAELANRPVDGAPVEADALAAALDALTGSGDGSLVPELHAHLARFLDEGNPAGRDLIASVLAAIAGPDALPALLEAAARDLSDSQVDLDNTIAELLRADPARGRRLVTEYATDGSVERRRVGLHAFGHLPGPKDIALLAAALHDPDRSVRLSAAGQLDIAVRHDAAYAALVEALRSPFEETRAAAVESLRRSGSPGAAADLTPAADDPSPQVRAAVANALGRLGGAASVTLLRRLADDTERSVREHARAALGRLDDLGPLLALADDPASGNRRSAAKALGAAVDADPLAARRLAELLRDDVAAVRAEAVSALFATRDRGRWAPLVLGLADDPDPVVRQRVAVILSHLDRVAAVPVLRRYMSDNDPTVRWVASTRLAQ
ncbi:HEAT repeat domain-containing protein [Dactylosporangium sp. NPDC050588]|uniref:HEAT repeat domain-containing protein n=1 Tax=Dactylosporangium sp. NPDC050588 TaxID=3157211 RepID=UPI0033FA7869